ncbi:MAG: PP2C family protein-serine/threonine phosphatase [Bryobacterales bacterium]|nr:PP2C family protein-serine/threonine phosphatase [Bryobacterales bacterium]
MAKERAPDAKRRLKWLYWGMTASLGPIFLFILYSWIFQKNIDSVPKPLVIGMILLLFIFPATLAYVIVVQRALDVRVALRQGLQYALAQRAMGIVTALAALAIIGITYQAVTREGTRSAGQLRAIAFSVIAVVVLQRIKAKASIWVDRLFFREQVETESARRARRRGSPHAGCGGVEGARLPPHLRGAPRAPRGDPRRCRRRRLRAHPAHLGWPQPVGHPGSGTQTEREPFSRADRNLLQTVAAQAGLALENARLTQVVAEEAAHRERLHHELEIAREVQERLLPQRPPIVQGLEYAGRCRPAQSIGGDAYDFFLTREGHLMATVADICGKGVPAALLMAGLQASLRGLCAGGVSNVGELMNRLNGLMWESTPRNRFATLWCGQYDRAAGLLRHVSAGHGDPVVVRASGLLERPACRGLALGLTRAAHYASGEVRLEAGDLIAVCTDGVTEARNPAGEEFGEERWAVAVAEAAGLSPERIVSHVLHAVDTFAAGAEQHDDLTIILLKVPA